MSAKTKHRARRFSADEERLVAQIVAANIATKAHAERVIETRQHAVIAAWMRLLAQAAATQAVRP